MIFFIYLTALDIAKKNNNQEIINLISNGPFKNDDNRLLKNKVLRLEVENLRLEDENIRLKEEIRRLKEKYEQKDPQ